VLASAPLDADTAAVRAMAEVQGRILSASEDEVVRASVLVNQLLSHQLLVRARAAAVRGACRREAPVTLSAPDGTLIEGIVDLAFEEAGVWTIIDYKTDREIAQSGEDRYRRQITLYVSAVERATGQPANGVLVRI
jgi:ATP-dependent exoDNAse (exonuclease V) beta subunit